MTTPTERTYRVPDVSCDHCVAAIAGEVGPLDGVASVVVDLAAKVVTVTGGDDAAIRAAIDEAGYEIAGSGAEDITGAGAEEIADIMAATAEPVELRRSS